MRYLADSSHLRRDDYSLSVLQKDSRLFITSSAPNTLPMDMAVGQLQVWRQKAEVSRRYFSLCNYIIRSNSFNCFESSVMQVVAQEKQEVKLKKSVGGNINGMDQFARQRTY